MSDRIRNISGIVLILFTLAVLFLSLLPFPQNGAVSLSGQGIPGLSAGRIPHIDSNDPINVGDTEVLCGFPGIGASVAAAVIQEREGRGLFIYPEDIMSVKGIGAGKLRNIRPLLHLDNTESGE